MAAISGLALLSSTERDPWQTTNFGTGELMRAAARITSSPVVPTFMPVLSKRAVIFVCVIAAVLPGCTLLGQRVRDCEGFDIPLSVFVGPSRKELRTRRLDVRINLVGQASSSRTAWNLRNSMIRSTFRAPSPGTRSIISRGARLRSTGNRSRLRSAVR